MAEQKIKYGSDVALTIAAWTTTLLAGEWATSSIFDNTTSLFEDVLLGGIIELAATTPLVGETLDIYIIGQYSGTATDMTGGIDALLTAAAEQVADVDFVIANLKLLVQIDVEATTPAIAQGYQWGPESVRAIFGEMPQRFALLLRNNTGAALAAGSDVNTVGVTHTIV